MKTDKTDEEFQGAFHIIETDAGPSTQTSKKTIAAEYGMSAKQLRKASAKALARVYEYILSWPDPRSQTNDHEDAQ